MLVCGTFALAPYRTKIIRLMAVAKKHVCGKCFFYFEFVCTELNSYRFYFFSDVN